MSSWLGSERVKNFLLPNSEMYLGDVWTSKQRLVFLALPVKHLARAVTERPSGGIHYLYPPHNETRGQEELSGLLTV